MATPVSNSTTIPVAFLNLQEDRASDSSEVLSPTNEFSSSWQSKFKSLRKQLEERDKTIQLQASSITNVTEEIKSKKAVIECQKAKIIKKNEEIENKVAALAKLDEQVALYQQDVLTLRQAQVQTVPVAASQNSERASFWKRMWEGFKGGVSSVGRFCRNNRRLFEAVAGIAGTVLALCFPPAAVPILLGVGAGTALFEWITSLFE